VRGAVDRMIEIVDGVAAVVVLVCTESLEEVEQVMRNALLLLPSVRRLFVQRQ
jgi:hypothetical protein